MRLAWKDLKYNCKKYLLITAIVVLMMFMVLFLSGLVDGLGRAVASGIENIPAGSFVLKEDAEELITVSSVTEDQYEEVVSQTQGKAEAIDIMRMYLQKEGAEDKMDIVFFAMNPQGFAAPDVYEGEALREYAGENVIVLDDDFAAEGIAVGDTLIVSTADLPLRVVGFSKNQMYGHVSAGFISLDTYTEIMETLNPQYQKRYHAVVLEEEEAGIDVEGLRVYSKQDIVENIPGYQAEQMTIKLVDWLLVAITAVIIGIFFFVLNLQKEKEFGVLKAIGFGMNRLVSLIVWEVFTVALTGALAAAGLTALMALALPGKMPFYLNWKSVVMILASFVVISLMGSLFSILRVGRIDPANIIGGDN